MAQDGQYYFELGRDGTKADFEAAYAALKAEEKPYDKIMMLKLGARAAFHQGRPENIQTLLAEPLKFHFLNAVYGNMHEEIKINVGHELGDLLCAGSHYPAPADPLAAARVALAAVPAAKRQQTLDAALLSAMISHFMAETLTGVLLDLGANPNAAVGDRAAGCILAHAVTACQSVATLKLLCAGGADFSVALDYARNNNFGSANCEKIEIYGCAIPQMAEKDRPPETAPSAGTAGEIARRTEALRAAARKSKPAVRIKPPR